MNEIILDDVAVGYGRKVVARGLSARLAGGQLTCLIGRNGLGKSTLLRTIAGFLPPLSGKITVRIGNDEYDAGNVSRGTMARLVSVVLTDKVDVANMTVDDIVGMGRMPYTNFFGLLTAGDRNIVVSAMHAVGIDGFASRDISTLSDGERQKVMIAKALAQQTPVMVLDEPTAFLDYRSRVDTVSLLHRLAHDMGKVVIVSTHDLDIALRHADIIITIDGGLRNVDKTALRARLSTS